MVRSRSTFEDTLLAVWRQALVEGRKSVTVESGRNPVRTTPNGRLRQVDFEYERATFRGLEQNPKTKSRWAELARKGSKVMQFLQSGRYVAVVVDGKLTRYSSRNE